MATNVTRGRRVIRKVEFPTFSVPLFRQEDVGERLLRKAVEANPRHQKTHAILARYFEQKNQPQKSGLPREPGPAIDLKNPVD